MILADLREEFYSHTGSLSTVNRQLAFAGIAVVWIFVVKKNSEIYIPDGLFWPLVLFIFSLMLDLSQYFYSSIAYQSLVDKKETELRTGNTFKEDTEFSINPVVNKFAEWCLYLKAASSIAGFVCLLYFFLLGGYVHASSSPSKKAPKVNVVKIDSSAPILFESPSLAKKLTEINEPLIMLEKSNREIRLEIKHSNDEHLDRHLKIINKNIKKAKQ
jgi:hypothetical protein